MLVIFNNTIPSSQITMQPMSSGLGSLQELSQDFMVAWSSFYLVVEKEVAYMKGKSFGKN